MEDISKLCSNIERLLSPHTPFASCLPAINAREIASISAFNPALITYGPIKNTPYPEPVSSMESSPCNSDEDVFQTEKTRVRDYALSQLGREFLDRSLVEEIEEPYLDDPSDPILLIKELSDPTLVRELILRLKGIVGKSSFKAKKVIYDGTEGVLLYIKERHNAHYILDFIKEDEILQDLLQENYYMTWITSSQPDLISSRNFYAALIKNLPRHFTEDLLYEFLNAKCPDARVLNAEKPIRIGNKISSMIRTESLEDVELICTTLNKMKVGNFVLEVGMHPDCSFRHSRPSRGPFREFRIWPKMKGTEAPNQFINQGYNNGGYRRQAVAPRVPEPYFREDSMTWNSYNSRRSFYEEENTDSQGFKTEIKDILTILKKTPSTSMVNQPMLKKEKSEPLKEFNYSAFHKEVDPDTRANNEADEFLNQFYPDVQNSSTFLSRSVSNPLPQFLKKESNERSKQSSLLLETKDNLPPIHISAPKENSDKITLSLKESSSGSNLSLLLALLNKSKSASDSLKSSKIQTQNMKTPDTKLISNDGQSNLTSSANKSLNKNTSLTPIQTENPNKGSKLKSQQAEVTEFGGVLNTENPRKSLMKLYSNHHFEENHKFGNELGDSSEDYEEMPMKRMIRDGRDFNSKLVHTGLMRSGTSS